MRRVGLFVLLMFALMVCLSVFSLQSCTKLTDLVPDDTSPPSVSILSPTNRQVFNTNSVSIIGNTSDEGSGVREVWLRLGSSGSFGRVNGVSSWSSNLTGLSDGTNVVYVYAVDNAGNTSSTQSVSFVVVLRVYVSTNGDDSNDGILKAIPVRSIQTALTRARSYNVNEIYITTGLYTPGNGLNIGDSGVVITNDGIKLVGGWDSGFNNIVGYSELDGSYIVKHVIFATNVRDIVISNLVIKGGRANGDYPHDSGGGIYLSNVLYGLIGNVIVSDNSSVSGGGGIYLESSYSNVISGSVCSNNAEVGGGVYLNYSYNNTISCNVYGNSATSGGGICLELSFNNTVSCGVYGNDAGEGGGIYLELSFNNTISGSVYNNRADQGGGIFSKSSYNNTMVGNIYSNTANNSGGGIYLHSSYRNVIGGSVYNNSAWDGGGVYLYSSHGNTLNSSIYGNRVSAHGGGIYSELSHTNTISGSIYGNVSEYHGGGICLYSSTNISILNSYITNNGASFVNSTIHLDGNLSALVISNCFIGGNDSTTSIGIYEDQHDIVGHNLVDNKFVVNKLRYLYREFTGSRLITNDKDWTNINNPLILDSTPDSTNNVVTNM
ncbi:MAG: NosD domain-containing protein [Brevinematia bacterium]